MPEHKTVTKVLKEYEIFIIFLQAFALNYESTKVSSYSPHFLSYYKRNEYYVPAACM